MNVAEREGMRLGAIADFMNSEGRMKEFRYGG